RATEKAKAERGSFWKRDLSSPDAYAASLEPNRVRLREMLGVVDPRLPVKALEVLSDTEEPAVVLETASATVRRVRWLVLEGVHGEGLLIEPKGPVHARIICLPDADTPPEKFLEAALVHSGAQVIIPRLASRNCEFSGSEAFNIRTNVPHREWIYRQAFIQGRHILGFELQKIHALTDWLASRPEKLPLAVAGFGEGGVLALYAGALDGRLDAVYLWSSFGPLEDLWQQPLYRSVYGLLREFGAAELAAMVAPRRLAVQHAGFPKVKGPPVAKDGMRAVAAPGFIPVPPLEAVQVEMQRARDLVPAFQNWGEVFQDQTGNDIIIRHLFPGKTGEGMIQARNSSGQGDVFRLKERPGAQRELVWELQQYCQRLLITNEAGRNTDFWQKLPLKSVVEFEAHTEAQRKRFWEEVIGKFPDPDVPVNPRSRQVRETEKAVIHEVVLDVWKDVFAWGWLALPKDLKPGDKRPVVVCQHGLEGLPEHCFETDESTRAWQAYKAFALRLAEQGYIVFAPHNPYRGKDEFRALQRRLHPLGKSLYSVINAQHQRILEWLKAQPFVQPDKIAFYGLSYGGKSAMRTPAVLKDYCFSICSGDFNEWVRKCASTDFSRSYVYAGEYEIWEWDLGGSFNYAEMGALIAPRPFMVERGHRDGVGVDEWVNYEYAKIRQLYNQLGIGDRTEIEHFDGPHTIHAVGTFDFIHRWFGEPGAK
ncbi:MAG TPA: alpha/beta hydrolase family protein, partial [Prosthecobacter sp.]